MERSNAKQILADCLRKNAESTDKLFAILLVLEWVASMIVAVTLSPLAWNGLDSTIHSHVLTAVFLGGLILALPLYLAIWEPGKVMTRHVIAIAQMLYSALFIHLTGGRIESHFHVFGSLAFLMAYWDVRVLITASIVVALDHFIRGMFFPLSVYGSLDGATWRWLEHGGWVLFEDGFLILAIRGQLQRLGLLAQHQAELIDMQATLDEKVQEQTQELKQYAQMVRNSHDAIYSKTTDGIITCWNPAATALFGYTQSEIIGQHASILQGERGRTAFELLEDVRLDPAHPYRDTVRRRKDGSLIHVCMSVSPLQSPEGEVIGITVVSRDMTKRVEADKRINEFYSTVSHELRSPLTSIRGALSMVTNNVIPAQSPEGMELLKIAFSSCNRLIRLINDMLDLRKIEAGKLELDCEPGNLTETGIQAVRAMQGMAHERGTTIDIVGESRHQVYFDKDRIEQVLANLISNAIKFAPPDTQVLVRIEDDADGVTVSVTDQGVGIPLELQHKLFEKFQQLDSSDSRAQEGSGLGLAISKALIEQHKGSIGLNSEVGKGSTFWFRLPSYSTPTVPLEAVPICTNRDDLIRPTTCPSA